MKPSFALNLSHDGLSLLRRATGGWQMIGAVDLDDPALGEKLAVLRRTAAEMAGGQMAAKLVIPNSQILYRTIECDSDDEAACRRVIEAELDGLTPYRIDELAYDWSPAGEGRLHIAAVARETLDEAETFATEHRFNPVSFVAIPEAGDFDGEPFFGVTSLSREIVARTDGVERDRSAILILRHGEPDVPDDVPDWETASRKLSEALGKKAEKDSVPHTETASIHSDRTAPGSGRDQDEDGKDAATRPDGEPGFASRRAATGATPSPAILDKIETRFVLVDAVGTDPEPATPPPESKQDQAELPGDPAGAVSDSGAEDSLAERGLAQEITRMPVTAAGLPGAAKTGKTRVRLAAETRDRIASATPAATGAGPALSGDGQDMAIFGSRDPAADTRPVKRLLIPIIVGLLFAALLAVLATGWITGAPMWSTLRGSDDNTAVATAPPATETGSAAVPPGQSEETTEPDSQSAQSTVEQSAPTIGDKAPSAPDIGLAALSTPPSHPAQISAPTESEVADLDAPERSPEALTAEQVFESTGIWPQAPAPLPDLETGRLSDLYVASIDRRVVGHDAIALPSLPQGLDQRPLGQFQPPPPSGTRFDLDERGLVRPTANGAATPSGALVFAGRPKVVPPPRPGAAAPSAPAPEQLSRLRPLARPANLVEQNERARLGGRSRAELARIRPVARPASPQAGKDTTPTELAVATSRKPVARPSGIAAAVRRALAEAQAGATSATRSTAAASAGPAATTVARRTAPSLPTTAYVAREATIEHAIPLSKINLIGVFGKPSERRALVRLKNGRLIKVKVGDKLDGGVVAEITSNQLRYIKRGKAILLEIAS